jgi:hypothetical protein
LWIRNMDRRKKLREGMELERNVKNKMDRKNNDC